MTKKIKKKKGTNSAGSAMSNPLYESLDVSQRSAMTSSIDLSTASRPQGVDPKVCVVCVRCFGVVEQSGKLLAHVQFHSVPLHSWSLSDTCKPFAALCEVAAHREGASFPPMLRNLLCCRPWPRRQQQTPVSAWSWSRACRHLSPRSPWVATLP